MALGDALEMVDEEEIDGSAAKGADDGGGLGGGFVGDGGGETLGDSGN